MSARRVVSFWGEGSCWGGKGEGEAGLDGRMGGCEGRGCYCVVASSGGVGVLSLGLRLGLRLGLCAVCGGDGCGTGRGFISSCLGWGGGSWERGRAVGGGDVAERGVELGC